MKLNNRLSLIEEYHFKDLLNLNNDSTNKNKEILDLSIGDPDLPVNPNIINSFTHSLYDKDFNKYPPYEGIKELKLQIIKYYKEVFSVQLNLDEVIILIGSKEGLNNLIPAVCDVDDTIISTEPSYPVYENCSKLWGCKSYKVIIKEKNNYIPLLGEIPKKIVSKSKLFIINYPNNPTGADVNEQFLKEIISFCEKYDIVLCNDAAYNEIILPYEEPKSLLQYDKNKNCIEFGSFSKTYNMTGFRIGFAVGNAKVIKALLKIKSNVDSGQFIPIQKAAISALNLDRSYIDSIRKIYYDRRKSVEKCLESHGIKYFKAKGTFYIWCKTPSNYTTKEFCKELLKKYGVIVTPGYVFGNMCYDYFRISLTKDRDSIIKILDKIKIYN